MSRKVIVILKTSGNKWPEIQSELQNEYSTTVSKRGMQKNLAEISENKEN